MTGEVRDRVLPCTRGVDDDVRRARLLAARSYTPRSLPRVAIMLGHWDGGSIVGAGRRRR